MKKMTMVVLAVFVVGCASSVPIAGYTSDGSLKVQPPPSKSLSVKKGEVSITEENFHLFKGQWVGLVKLFTIKSGVLKQNASLDIKIGDRKMVLFIGRSNIFEGIALKDDCLFSEKKETGEWIKVALEDGKLRVEFEIKNKNPNLPNIKGEGSFVRYQN